MRLEITGLFFQSHVRLSITWVLIWLSSVTRMFVEDLGWIGWQASDGGHKGQPSTLSIITNLQTGKSR